ncbi:hypothetical protein BKA70DRAFT_1324573 [Coprinopsis sp. MPI-PUGE-AT-0042]|nr:hypothetical protein BKA70DRAFT_1324573 [Coprinopsis sp. MPI-PUGE-AT-0042]
MLLAIFVPIAILLWLLKRRSSQCPLPSTSPRPGSLCIPFIHTSKPRNRPSRWPTRTTWLLPGGSNVRRSAGGM